MAGQTSDKRHSFHQPWPQERGQCRCARHTHACDSSTEPYASLDATRGPLASEQARCPDMSPAGAASGQAARRQDASRSAHLQRRRSCGSLSSAVKASCTRRRRRRSARPHRCPASGSPGSCAASREAQSTTTCSSGISCDPSPLLAASGRRHAGAHGRCWPVGAIGRASKIASFNSSIRQVLRLPLCSVRNAPEPQKAHAFRQHGCHLSPQLVGACWGG